MLMRQWCERELKKLDRRMEEYNRQWRRQLVIILVRDIALVTFATILVWMLS